MQNEEAIRTAMQELGYTRRITPRKGFSTEPRVIAKRLAFAQEAIQWSRERLQNTVHRRGLGYGWNTHASVHYDQNNGSENIFGASHAVRKRSKAPAWMFWGAIIQGQKGPARFWEKEWGSMNSEKYYSKILDFICPLFREHPEYWDLRR
jgi:hypothetical protein